MFGTKYIVFGKKSDMVTNLYKATELVSLPLPAPDFLTKFELFHLAVGCLLGMRFDRRSHIWLRNALQNGKGLKNTPNDSSLISTQQSDPGQAALLGISEDSISYYLYKKGIASSNEGTAVPR